MMNYCLNGGRVEEKQRNPLADVAGKANQVPDDMARSPRSVLERPPALVSQTRLTKSPSLKRAIKSLIFWTSAL